MSGLALAMATNRTLLVRDWFAFPSRLGELFTAPCTHPHVFQIASGRAECSALGH